MFNSNISAKLLAAFFFFLIMPLAWPAESRAALLQLSWADNSNNEDGFKVERATGATGTFTQIALTGANVTSLADSNATAGTNYCYRVRAYNTGGDSAYSNAACATAAAITVNLSIAKAGSGSGTVSSAPSGINCGATCAGSFAASTAVTLTATAAAGSAFSGWSGDPDCSDGSVTMNTDKSCTATFQLQSSTLSVNLVNAITSAGAGAGSVTSAPAGINCGTDCLETYLNGTAVTLTAVAASGSVFSGWSGAGCSGTGSCTVVIASATSVTATFAPQSFTLTVIKAGNGTVTSGLSGIDCGSTCSASYAGGASVILTPTPASGATFLGWTGAGCSGTSSCTIIMTANATVTAAFSGQIAASIGVFRPQTGEWLLDLDGNGAFDDCTVDRCVQAFGQQGDLPLVGSWTNTEITLLGVFDTNTAAWHLDLDGSSALDGCELDTCGYTYGQPGDLPVVGKWTKNGPIRIGFFRPSTRRWYLDLNGNGDVDGCKKGDRCTRVFGKEGDLPVVGDWNGKGRTKIGVYRPSTGHWILDNGNGTVNKCGQDRCAISFGLPGDLPVAGDWDGSGTDKIGVFRPTTGEWFLDHNGNREWDGCEVDACLTFGQTGDLPVVGKW
ncbi:MAG: InlB B-repeat-containing protein [Candidatus Binatia bacterium]